MVDGWSVLDRLKRNPATRHIPVNVISVNERNQRVASMGAFAYLEKPVSKEALDGAFAHIGTFLDRKAKRLLLIEDDPAQNRSISELIGAGEDVELVTVQTGDEALRALDEQEFDCVVLDLVLPDQDGTRLLEQIKTQARFKDMPVVVYTAKELSKDEERRLKRFAESVIGKNTEESPERLLSDTALFLHRVEASMPPKAKAMLAEARLHEASLQGKKVLVVDDDVRNIFAITSMLESYGLEVVHAENGKAALELLDKNPLVDVVLMDLMMPEMDGYETMRHIRADGRFDNLPIIAVTAKALKDDRDKCIAAGASDYLPKPVQEQKLVEVITLWTKK